MVKQLTGLPINHVVNVDFLGFVRAVDAIGCVYVDVDRRYYHSNVGLPASEQYAEINIQPGYQLLCGKEALAVRALPPHRHRPGPLGAPAGLPQRRPRAGPDRRPGPRPQRADRHLHRIHDLRHQRQGDDAPGAGLFVASRNATIKEVHFPAELGPSYVYRDAGSDQRRRRPVPRHRSQRRAARLARRRRRQERQEARARRGRARRSEASRSRSRSRSRPAGRPGPGEAKRAKPRRGGGPQGQRQLPVFFPTRLPSGAFYVESNPYEHIQDPRVYHLKDDRRGEPPRRLPDGRVARTRRRHALLRGAGDPGLVGPADPRQPEPTQDDRRP